MRQGRVVDMGMGMVVPVRMVTGMAMIMVVMMGVGRDGNHVENVIL